jgi:hypothetical protein
VSHKLWIKERWKLTLPKDSKSPTNSIHKTHDIVIQSCVLSHIGDSRVLHSAGPFTVKYQLPSGKIVERSAKLSLKQTKWERRRKRQQWLNNRIAQLRSETRGFVRSTMLAQAKTEYSFNKLSGKL